MVSDPVELFQRNLKNTKFTILFCPSEIRQLYDEQQLG